MAARAQARRENAEQTTEAATFVAAEAERRLPPPGFSWADKSEPDGPMLCLRCGRTLAWFEGAGSHLAWHDDGEPEQGTVFIMAGVGVGIG